MALKARYDPREDRMLLFVSSGGEDRRMWVTRRLWLGFYRQIARLAPAESEAASAKPPALPGKAVPIPQEDTKDATVLQSVQITASDNGVQLVFATGRGDEKFTIKVGQPGIAQFRRLLEMQSERAGWDPAAAVERLDAQAGASAALQRAKR